MYLIKSIFLSTVAVTSSKQLKLLKQMARSSLKELPASLFYSGSSCLTASPGGGLTASNKKPVLTLYTKTPCPLCDEALNTLKPYLDQVIFEKVDILAQENQEWWKKYRYDIPVFHLDGKFLMKHRANINEFKRALVDWHSKVH